MPPPIRVNLSAYNNFINQTVQPYLLKKANEIANEAKSNAPEGSGELKNSIVVERKLGGRVSIEVKAPHAGFVHQGTGPGHVPNPRPNYIPALRSKGLIRWAAQKGLNPYAIAHGITQHGTESNPFLERAIVNRLGSLKFRWIKKELEF